MAGKRAALFFLVKFRHNHHSDRLLSFGRIWWYQNFRVSENQIAFVHYDDLSITHLCPQNQSPKNPKSLREVVRIDLPQVQLFDTMSSYFMTLTNSLGGITKDDLKILNRAFYVKSISQIDQFIRDNMLIESENPHLDRLLENVRNGQEIAYSIHTCNQKISAIEKVLKHLTKVQTITEKKQKIEFERQLLSLYKDWIDLKNAVEQIESEQKEIKQLESALPQLELDVLNLSSLKDRLHQQLYQKDIDTRLQQIDSEIRHLADKTQILEQQRLQFEARLKKLNLKSLSTPENWPEFLVKIQQNTDKTGDQIIETNAELEKLREKKIRIETGLNEVREELDHLSKFRTLIPKDLYSIKESAQDELGLPSGQLFFVGELIQVKKEFQGFRRAIESVLFPISRNLLCAPESLNDLTKWLDNKGLRADITVKRIKSEELDVDVERALDSISADDILGMIDVLPESENPFYSYLWKWLTDVFHYRLVAVSKFKSDEQKLVTQDGLVKTDNRTFRKLKDKISFSLGWDNKEVIEALTKKLLELNTDHHSTLTFLDQGIKKLEQLEERRQILNFFRDEQPKDFLSLGSLQKTLQTLELEKTSLLKANPDYFKLKKEAEDVGKSLDIALARISDGRSQIHTKKQLLVKIKNVKECRDKDLKSSLLYAQAIAKLGSEPALTIAFEELYTRLERGQQSRIAYESDLQTEAESLDIQRTRHVSAVSIDLGNYRREYNDPNLVYEISEKQSLIELVEMWSQAEEKLRLTELPQAQEKWRKFFDQILMDSVKDTINEIKAKSHDTLVSIQSINEVLKLTNFEDLPTEKRYLKIDIQASADDRIRKFKRQMVDAEKTLGPAFRNQIESQSADIMKTLADFVEGLQNDTAYRLFVTDVRNHFHFKVQSLRRLGGAEEDLVMETFTGARKDAKSSAQTTQLAYALLASCLAYRFRFHDPVRGKDTPRLLVLDEFGGKFDNEKPKEILKLLDQMGFQSVLVSPMSKADLLAGNVNYLVLVYKVSASHSKTQSYPVTSKHEYDRLIGRKSDPSEVLT